MELNQLNAEASASSMPYNAPRTRTAMRSALRIDSRSTLSSLARDIDKAHLPLQLDETDTQPENPSFGDIDAQPTSLPESRVSEPGEEDAWLNDAMPPLSALKRPQREAPPPPFEKRLQPEKEIETPLFREQNSYVSEHEDHPGPALGIRPGHALWPVVLQLSTRIWEEIMRVQGKVPGQRRGMVDFVRRRALALLRGEPALAGHMRTIEEAEQVLHGVVDEVLGYGPLEELLVDEYITEVMVVGTGLTFIERMGKIHEVDCHFEDEQHMMRVISNMLWRAGRSVEPGRTMLDARLPDGTLVNIVMPPPAIKGPTITMRKPSRVRHGLAELVRLESMSQEMADFLATCVRARLNIIICGERRSGRTTLLNALAACIPANERIVTVEEMAELRLSQKHVVTLEAYAVEDEEQRQPAMRNLVMNALHMQPGRLLVGECRGVETADLLSAMHSGYDGSMTTIFARHAQDCVSRLEMLWLMGEPQLPYTTIRKQVARCLNLIVQVGFASDRSRKVLEIVAVQGDDREMVKLQSIYHYVDAGIDEKTGRLRGGFEPQGVHPACFTVAASAR
ncbi:MAG TPA: ATPase, T2SS/T4P/T4SS family [Ktedonobacteraceae bacterium]|jgi:pilus assembly protein CpaF|nr:ATPase, T2SS/T4P/T4SS family [Ktedonobacteraceae bacterium]